MIRSTIRFNNKYLYNKIKAMAEFNHMSINSMIIELLEIGFLEKEKAYRRNR